MLSDNPSPVQLSYNLVTGRYQHAISVTAGTSPGSGRLWNNTIVGTGCATVSGDASAVFVSSAASLELRNNIVCYDNPDNLGIAFWVNDATKVASLASGNNCVCSRDPSGRHLAYNGTRLTLGAWQTQTGQDAVSVAGTPPTFDGDWRVTSTNLGLGRGVVLGLPRDYSDKTVPAAGPVDLGAYQTG